MSQHLDCIQPPTNQGPGSCSLGCADMRSYTQEGLTQSAVRIRGTLSYCHHMQWLIFAQLFSVQDGKFILVNFGGADIEKETRAGWLEIDMARIYLNCSYPSSRKLDNRNESVHSMSTAPQVGSVSFLSSERP